MKDFGLNYVLDCGEDFVLQNFWQFDMYFPNGSISTYGGSPSFIYVQSLGVPNLRFEMDSSFNSENFITSVSSYGQVSMTFFDTESLRNYKKFKTWEAAIYDKELKAFTADWMAQKTHGNLYLMPAPEGYKLSSLKDFPEYLASIEKNPPDITPIATIQLKGLMLQGLGDWDLSQDNGSPRNFSVTMSVDNVI